MPVWRHSLPSQAQTNASCIIVLTCSSRPLDMLFVPLMPLLYCVLPCCRMEPRTLGHQFSLCPHHVRCQPCAAVPPSRCTGTVFQVGDKNAGDAHFSVLAMYPVAPIICTCCCRASLSHRLPTHLFHHAFPVSLGRGSMCQPDHCSQSSTCGHAAAQTTLGAFSIPASCRGGAQKTVETPISQWHGQ